MRLLCLILSIWLSCAAVSTGVALDSSTAEDAGQASLLSGHTAEADRRPVSVNAALEDRSNAHKHNIVRREQRTHAQKFGHGDDFSDDTLLEEGRETPLDKSLVRKKENRSLAESSHRLAALQDDRSRSRRVTDTSTTSTASTTTTTTLDFDPAPSPDAQPLPPPAPAPFVHGPIACQWSNWTAWSDCTKATSGCSGDGGGGMPGVGPCCKKTRTRSINVTATNGGADCTGANSEVLECTTHAWSDDDNECKASFVQSSLQEDTPESPSPPAPQNHDKQALHHTHKRNKKVPQALHQSRKHEKQVSHKHQHKNHKAHASI